VKYTLENFSNNLLSCSAHSFRGKSQAAKAFRR
jgi:hypothetical protein